MKTTLFLLICDRGDHGAGVPE